MVVETSLAQRWTRSALRLCVEVMPYSSKYLSSSCLCSAVKSWGSGRERERGREREKEEGRVGGRDEGGGDEREKEGWEREMKGREEEIGKMEGDGQGLRNENKTK